MSEQIQAAVRVLEEFRESARVVDRAEVVAHATLSAWVHHWPSSATASQRQLLEETGRVRLAEASRWMVQRRIALAQLARSVSPT